MEPRRFVPGIVLTLLALSLATTAGAGRRFLADPISLGRASYGAFLTKLGARVELGPVHRLQRTPSECGLAVLGETMRLLHRTAPSREELAARSGLSSRGIELTALTRVARELGLSAVRIESSVLSDIPPLTIALLRYRHFVLVREVQIDTVRVFDPMLGEVGFPREVFAEYWTGHGIAVGVDPSSRESTHAGT
jgi:ABC-type bacteriocin/lantibiotic exporter with double-glycine peptidase domain